MYGLTFFCMVGSWFFLIEDYSINTAFHRGCSYAFWVFLATALFYSYKIIPRQCTRILSYTQIKEATSKWTWSNTIDTVSAFFYVFLYWVQLGIVIVPLWSTPENFITSVAAFVIISLVTAQIQTFILMNGVISSVRSCVDQ